MQQITTCIVPSLMMLLVVLLSDAEESIKLQDVLRNSGNSSSNYSDVNLFKERSNNLLRKCGVENSENKQNQSDGHMNGNRRNFSDYNSDNQNSMRNTEDWSNRYNTDSSYNAGNPDRTSRNPYNGFDYGSSRGGTPQGFFNKTLQQNLGASYNNDGYGRGQGTNYNSYKNDGNNHYGRPDYDRNYFESRVRRSSNRNDENQCISQCVFGYMELMDENQTPSETRIIRWLQDHMANNDMKRIKLLREVRRCFARLSSSDIEDGCEFSKQLSICMNLDLE